MKLLPFGSAPEFDECPGFGRFWAVIQPKYRIAKGAVRREWYKLNPDKHLEQRMIEAIQIDQASSQWRAGYAPRLDRWIRDERYDDYREPSVDVSVPACEHTPPCHNWAWHQVVMAREREEIA